MRWEELFADLEAQLRAAEDAGLATEVADRTRRETALLRLVDRCRAAVGRRVLVGLSGAGVLDGTLTDVGAEWLLVAEPGGREALVPLTAVSSVSGLGPWSATPGSAGQVFARLGLGHALRALARDRLPVALGLRDGSVLTGTVERVGADFLEASEHGPGEPRRAGEVTGVRTVPFAALAVVRRCP